MLVLSRKVGQSIVISDRITLTVSRISSNRVTLAFDAPRHVQILRSELTVLDGRIDDGLDRPQSTSTVDLDETYVAPIGKLD